MPTFEKQTPIYLGNVRGKGNAAKETAMCDTVNAVLSKGKTFTATLTDPDTYVNKLEWSINGDFDWRIINTLKPFFSTVDCVGNVLTISKEDPLFDQSMINQKLEEKTNSQAFIINVAVLIIFLVLAYYWHYQ